MDEPVYHLKKVVQAKSEDREDFAGPLDLILHLLGKHKIAIKDISISLILDQYLAYLDQQKQLDLEIASEFIQMASHLMLLKTKLLLSEADAEAKAEMEALIQSLEERQRRDVYQKISACAKALAEGYQTGINCIPKPPEPLPKDTRPYAHRPRELERTLMTLIDRVKRRTPPSARAIEEILRFEPYAVEQKTDEVLKRLSQGEQVGLMDLFRQSRSRSELIATFLSVLDLCRSGQVHLQDDGMEILLFLPEKKGA